MRPFLIPLVAAIYSFLLPANAAPEDEPPLPDDPLEEQEAALPDSDLPPLPESDLAPMPDVDAKSPEDEGGGTEQTVPGTKIRAPQIPRTYSEDSMYIVYGDDSSQRVEAFKAAREIRADLMRALRFEDRWSNPIVIQLHKTIPLPGKTAAAPSVTPIAGEIRLQVDVAAGCGIPHREFRNAVVRMTLAEMVTREMNATALENAGELPLPEWISQGVMELMDHRKRGRPTALFASVLKLGQTLTIDEILNADTDGMDSISAGIFRVSSCGLLQMLLEQPRGPELFRMFLLDLSNQERGMLWLVGKHFPNMRDEQNSLEKWWSVQLASLAEPGMDELLSMKATENKLTAALRMRFDAAEPPEPPKQPGGLKKLLKKFSRDSKNLEENTSTPTAAAKASSEKIECALTDIDTYFNRRDRRQILERNLLQLMELTYNAHPFYRKVIMDYQDTLALLTDGKRKEAEKRLADLARRRERMLQDACEVEDYLDWYEATQRTTRSGDFDQYLRTAREIEKQKSTPKPGVISEYLDELEKEFGP